MSKKRTNQSTKNNKKKSSKKSRAPVKTIVVNGPQIDREAMRWINLIANPCTGGLAHPTYGGGSTGYLARVRVSTTIARTTGNNCVAIFAHPAAGVWYSQSVDLASTNAFGSVWNNGGELPSIVQEYRPVAACLKVRFIGAEKDRSGSVSWGQRISVESAINTTTTGIQYDQVLTAGDRVPATEVELKCYPDDSWQFFREKGASLIQTEVIRMTNGVGVIAYGLPASASTQSDIVLEWTLAYEWRPEPTVGLQAPSNMSHSKTPYQVVSEAVSTMSEMIGGIEGLRKGMRMAYTGYRMAAGGNSSFFLGPRAQARLTTA
jgi:hypothetical protein